jgi:hypothetical protein
LQDTVAFTLLFFEETVYSLGMNRNTISFQSIVENGVIQLPAAYREVFTAPVVVTVREIPKEKPFRWFP